MIHALLGLPEIWISFEELAPRVDAPLEERSGSPCARDVSSLHIAKHLGPISASVWTNEHRSHGENSSKGAYIRVLAVHYGLVGVGMSPRGMI